MPAVPYRCTENLRKGGARAWHHSISKILVLFKVSESVTPFVIHSDEKMRINVSSRAAAWDLWLYGCGNCFEIRDEMYTMSQKQKIMTSSSPNYMLEQSMFLLISFYLSQYFIFSFLIRSQTFSSVKFQISPHIIQTSLISTRLWHFQFLRYFDQITGFLFDFTFVYVGQSGEFGR